MSSKKKKHNRQNAIGDRQPASNWENPLKGAREADDAGARPLGELSHDEIPPHASLLSESPLDLDAPANGLTANGDSATDHGERHIPTAINGASAPDEGTQPVACGVVSVAPSVNLEKVAESGEQESLPGNYGYWREAGGEWPKIYDDRKLTRPKYHIQEIMLAEYMSHNAPAKVLEFGCGVGRHLSYLSRIPELDVYGYDQSQTMVAGCRRWAPQEWIDRHVTVGMPTGRLPYEDKSFDIVYTSEVLVHVHPADLQGILSELLRIARWHVLHLEMSPNIPVVSDDHNGCWNHDLVSAYQVLGYQCEMMPLGYIDHTPFRVVLDPTRKVWSWTPVSLALARRTEMDLEHGFAMIRGQLAEREREMAEVRNWHTELERRIAICEQDLVKKTEECAELIVQIKADRRRLEGEIGDKRDVINAQVQEIDGLKRRLFELERNLEASSQSCEQLRIQLEADRRRLEGEIGDKREVINAHVQEIDGLKRRLYELERNLEASGQACEQLRTQMEADCRRLEGEIGDKRDLIASQRDELEKQHRQLEGFVAEVEQAKVQAAELSGMIETQEAKIAALGLQVSRRDQEIQQLREMLNAKDEQAQWLEYEKNQQLEAIEARHVAHYNQLAESSNQVLKDLTERVRAAVTGHCYDDGAFDRLSETYRQSPELFDGINLAHNVFELNQELLYLRRSMGYRWGRIVTQSRLFRLLYRLRFGSKNLVKIETLGNKSEESGGTEVWLLEVRCNAFPFGIPLKELDYDRSKVRQMPNDCVPYGYNLLTTEQAAIRMLLPREGTRLFFLMHDWSGRIAITADHHTQIFDLYSKDSKTVCIDPFTKPMTASLPLLSPLRRVPRAE